MMISKPELEVHESFKVLHVRTEVNISKALSMQLKELGRSSSQPPEGDFCSPRLPQREFLAPRIQAPEFRDPSYPKGILTPIMGLLRLTPTHTSTPERVWRLPNPGSDKGTQFQVCLHLHNDPGRDLHVRGPLEEVQWLTTVRLQVAASATFSWKTSWAWCSWRCRCWLSP